MRAAWAGPCRRQRRDRGGSRLRLSPQKEEENRKLEEKRRAEEERRRLEQERRERELREAALREQRHQQQGGEAGPHRCGGAAPTSSLLPRAVPQGRGGGAEAGLQLLPLPLPAGSMSSRKCFQGAERSR